MSLTTYLIAERDIPLVKALRDRVQAVSERAVALESRYHGECKALAAELTLLKREIAESVCKMCGVPYDPEKKYGVETSYLEHDIAFLGVVDPTKAAEDPMVAPPGTRLN